MEQLFVNSAVSTMILMPYFNFQSKFSCSHFHCLACIISLKTTILYMFVRTLSYYNTTLSLPNAIYTHLCVILGVIINVVFRNLLLCKSIQIAQQYIISTFIVECVCVYVYVLNMYIYS